ncbi:aminotransferase class V-fold PLP-dependent enzyme [Candidatus Saccharibacteria bacterium]|nr:aminotransferase class V-fold PLP-dependent enzyme [Candidatus Saccharibacteria bacterium]MBR3378251.1 aminotransferase class V-fold PLP-dependent enzyme [Candidatus Saccharibacteria bacterium]
MDDFDYLRDGDVYLDSACQSLRPRPVIDALNRYYTEHNSCGERVKYAWGRKTDELVEDTRAAVLKYLKLKSKDYSVSFTLNTTYGINLLLQQFKNGLFKKVMTSDIEHNSPFLSTMTFAKRQGIPREIMERERDGSIDISKYDFKKTLVVVNSASNIDGRKLLNIKELVKAVHKQGGTIIIDAAQALAHSSDILEKTEADAICSSAHKMYGPSLGLMIVRRDLFDKIETSFIGGGMVDDVDADKYQLSAESPNHAYTKFESGLQAWGEIIAFGEALKWLEKRSKADKQNLADCAQRLFDFLKSQPKVHLINEEPNPTMSFYIEGLDSHMLGQALSNEGIMARTGYFCVHYYLDHKMHYPPLIRFSFGYHIRPSDIDKTINTLERILS